MKEITLKIEDDVYRDILSNVYARGICSGMHGVLDSFILRLFKEMKKGTKEYHFEFKNKKGKEDGKTEKNKDR